MRKKITAVCLALSMALMSGCAGQSTTDSSDKNVQQSESGETAENVSEASDSEASSSEESGSDTDASAASDGASEDNASDSASAAGSLKDMDMYLEKYTTYSDADDGHRLFTGSIDKLILSDEAKAAYPKLAGLIEDYNTQNENTLRDNISDASYAAEDYQNNPEYFSEYTSEDSLSFCRVDDKILSFTDSFNGYTGGAHGYYGVSGKTYDLETETEIDLFDVIKDKDELIEYVKGQLDELYPGLRENEPDVDNCLDSYFGEYADSICWSMEATGITIYFNPYSIASYAAGMQVIPVLFDKNPELFTDKYTNQEGDWACAGSDSYIDLDGDKVIDHVYAEDVIEYYDDYSEIEGIKIYVNDKSYEFNLHCFKKDCYTVKKGNKYYLYVIGTSENDWRDLYVYQLAGDEVTEAGSLEGAISGPVSYYDYDEISYTNTEGQLYNPSHFYMSTRMDLISTFDGYRLYEADENGIPQPVESMYHCSATSIEFTSKVELTLDVVDEDGNVIEEDKRIAAGRVFKPYRTDNKKIADLTLEDGTIVRVEVDSSDWPRKIGGMELEEVFDGTVFAG